jgi:hypothetical protein
MGIEAKPPSGIAAFWANRIKWGVRWGVIVAAVFGGFAVILRVLDGPESFQEHGTTLGTILEAYGVAGVVCGLIIGLFRPLLRSQAWSALTGMLCGTVIGFALAVFNHEIGWSFVDLLLPGMFAICGCASGVLTNRKMRSLGRL